MYAQDSLNSWANAHSTILPQSSVQKVGAFFRSLHAIYLSVQEPTWDPSIPGEELGM